MPEQSASRSDYIGCGLWAAGFLVLVIVSFAVGVVLRPESDQSDTGVDADSIQLVEVGAEGDGYRLLGDRDEVGDPCVVLFQRRAEVTGQCGFNLGQADRDDDAEGRYSVTSSRLEDDTTVVFGPVPEGTRRVTFALSDGSEADVAVERNQSADVSFFVYESEADVEGSATFLGPDGEPIPDPG